MNVFPDRNDPFGSQSTLQLSFTSAHRIPRKTYSKRGRTRDTQKNVKTPCSGSAASAITARTNSKVARLKAKNDSEIDVFEFDEDEGHESWVQGRMTKQRTNRDSGSDVMEIESSSSNKRSSPSPSAPVNSHYFVRSSKSKVRITPEGKNMDVPSAPRKSILPPSKAVLKEFVNEAWKFRGESKTKDEGDDTLTRRPSKVRIMSKAEEIIVKPASEVRQDDEALRRRSRTKSKYAVKQEKTATLISSNLNREQTRLSKESQLQKPIFTNDTNIMTQHNTSTSLPARMKRIYLSSDNGDDLSALEVAPSKLTASNQFAFCEKDEFEDDDIYDMTGPISTSTPNTRTADTGLQNQAVNATVKVPETKKLFTVKTEIGRLAISPVKNNRSEATKRVTLGGIPDLSMPLTTQNTVAPMKKSRSGISVYRDVPGISPVKHGSVSELEHNTAANTTLNAGIKTCAKKQSSLQSVVQSHARMGTLSKSDKQSTNQPTSTIEVSSRKHSMSRYGRRVIYEDDDEDELAL
ncbi:hypothetical protein V1520DRAFT_338918 [Lipomyces starkeyi]|uniref:Uncharacterized protein n=1 Tax=Lipomyces starkeyi NRRL Y-11557 TaxID=675824 RepID=A0A1E3PZU7_LIPST|nr:hypothetical protein LIPSTDRAFT_29631 [Lipomyces starkeyi NRRL Y-11557]